MAFAAASYAQNIELAEQKIKAGMIYNFLKYTEWPAQDTDQPMAVCIYGRDPFDGNLQPMEERGVNLRKIHIRSMNNPQQTAGCNLIVVGKEAAYWAALQPIIHGKPVLTVGDYDGFARKGGIIEFGHRDNHISVTLNRTALQAAGLSVQPRLLQLVTVIDTNAEAK